MTFITHDPINDHFSYHKRKEEKGEGQQNATIVNLVLNITKLD